MVRGASAVVVLDTMAAVEEACAKFKHPATAKLWLPAAVEAEEDGIQVIQEAQVEAPLRMRLPVQD